MVERFFLWTSPSLLLTTISSFASPPSSSDEEDERVSLSEAEEPSEEVEVAPSLESEDVAESSAAAFSFSPCSFFGLAAAPPPPPGRARLRPRGAVVILRAGVCRVFAQVRRSSVDRGRRAAVGAYTKKKRRE